MIEGRRPTEKTRGFPGDFCENFHDFDHSRKKRHPQKTKKRLTRKKRWVADRFFSAGCDRFFCPKKEQSPPAEKKLVFNWPLINFNSLVFKFNS